MPVHACLSACKGTAVRKGGPGDRWTKTRGRFYKDEVFSGGRRGMGMKRENVGACEGEKGSGLDHRRRKALLLMPDCSHMGDGFAPILCLSVSLLQ